MSFNPNDIVWDSKPKFNPNEIMWDSEATLMEDNNSSITQQQINDALKVPAVSNDNGALDRFGAGLQEARSSFNKNVVNPFGEYIGTMTPEEKVARDELADKSMNEALLVEKQYLDANPDAWNIAGGLGKYAPDIATGVVSKAKALGTGALDFGLEYARTGDMVQSMQAAVLGAVGAKAVDKMTDVLAKPTKTAFGKLVDSLPIDQKKSMDSIVETLENLGIKKMDEEARTKLIETIDLSKSTQEVSEQVTERLMQMRGRAKNIKNAEYTKADELASGTRAVQSTDFISLARKQNDGSILDIQNMTKAEKKVFKDIKTRLERAGSLTAEGIEKRIQELSKEAYKKSNESEKYLYDRVIGSVDKPAVGTLRYEQNRLLSEKGIDGVYDTARAADQEYKRRYLGSIDGKGSTAGKKVKSVLKAQDNANVSESLLNRTFDINLASQVKREFSSQTRKDMAMDVLSRGIDKDSLDSPDGVKVFISNYGKANPEGLKALLGKDTYVELKKNVDALALVQSTIETAGKFDDSIIKDVTSFTGAILASKISPYASMHVAINSAKAIADKKLIGKNKIDLIKRVNTIEDKKVRADLLKAIRMITIPAATLIAEDKNTEKKLQNLGLKASELKLATTNPNHFNLDGTTQSIKDTNSTLPFNIGTNQVLENEKVFNISQGNK